MWIADTFNDVNKELLAHRLGKAMKLLENYFLTYPGHPEAESFRTYASHYELLASYWKNGFSDPQRDRLYDHLLRQLYMLTGQLMQRDSNSHSTLRQSLMQRVVKNKADLSATAIRYELESFVSEAGMLSLEPEHVRPAKSKELYRRHQALMSDVFNYIWLSAPWLEPDVDVFCDLLLSPTIDSTDQQLLVTAITLSALNVFDIQKLRLLTKVYRQATDEQVRQRALVGWSLVADAEKAQLFTEETDMIQELCEDIHCRQELAELQIQLVYCLDTEADNRKIQNEIMPDLLNHSNIKITRQGIVETEDDALEDILHPDAAEQNMEKLEESMRKMMNMQQQGSDIYFGGFSQMKRFPFFYELSNWFVPFYPQHPDICDLWNRSKGRKFLHTITKIGAFCNSDKYSFVLAFEQVLNHLPTSMLNLIEQGEATPMPVGGEISTGEQKKPAFIRRMYLQDIYRFFKVCNKRDEFLNPFSTDTKRYLFFANPMFKQTAMQQHAVQIASFLVKRKMYKEALMVLEGWQNADKDFHYCMLMGTLVQRNPELSKQYGEASVYYQKATALRPDHERSLSGLARSLFNERDYVKALSTYETLLLMNPGNLVYELSSAVCQLNLRQYDEALQKLYRLNYDHPDDLQIKRSLAWALTLNDKQEAAEKIYEQLVAEPSPLADDQLNYGYCLWFQHKNEEAIRRFRLFIEQQKGAGEQVDTSFIDTGSDLLKEHGITDADIHLMYDQVFA